MHNENTRLFYVCLKSLKLQTGMNNVGKFFVRKFEILKALTNYSQRI